MRIAQAIGSASLIGALLVMTGCSGGGDSGPKAAIDKITVFGDSLADSGTFGLKFTVQTGSAQIWPELVAAQYRQSLCHYYVATSATTFANNPTAGCTNHAIGGGRINNYTDPASPLSILQQMQARAALGSFSSTELVLADGGGNDAADLVGAFLKYAAGDTTTFPTLLGTLLDPTVVTNTLAQTNGSATVGALYMQALADRFSDAISTQLIANGASRIAALNMPPVQLTPRFQTVLGTLDAATRATVSALADTWVQTFNSRLASNLQGNGKVAIVDFYTDFKNEISTPAQYGLVDAATPVCPITGLSGGLPDYDFTQCTVANVSARYPNWEKYAFSDSFHPTPYGHQLISQSVALALAKAGWL